MFSFRKDIPYKSLAEIQNDGCSVTNGVVKSVSIGFIGHFGCSTLALDISTHGWCFGAFGGYALTHDLGFLIAVLFDLFNIVDDDYVDVNKLRDRPLRVICKGSEAVGIGNFLDDNKFFYISDLMAAFREKSDDVGRK